MLPHPPTPAFSALPQIQRKLIAALILAFIFMLVEVVGGIMAHSLAIITDAAHLLSDVSGFAVAVLAAFWAKRKSHEHFSYGYHRVEVCRGRVLVCVGGGLAVLRALPLRLVASTWQQRRFGPAEAGAAFVPGPPCLRCVAICQLATATLPAPIPHPAS